MPPGRMIFFVITAEGGSAIATFLVLVPLFFTSRRKASATSSNFSMLPSDIQPRSSGSIAQRSSTRLPALSRPNSTSFTPDELMSTPSNGAGWLLKSDPNEIKTVPCNSLALGNGYLRFHFNAISKHVVPQRFFRFRQFFSVVKSRRFAGNWWPKSSTDWFAGGSGNNVGVQHKKRTQAEFL